MKKFGSCLLFLLFIVGSNVKAQNSNTNKSSSIPFQGTKEFCEFYQRSKYIVSIKVNAVSINYIHGEDTVKINGKIVNGKLFTNDPEEKENKNLAGRYYLLTKDMIRILNGENGDYNEYDVCK